MRQRIVLKKGGTIEFLATSSRVKIVMIVPMVMVPRPKRRLQPGIRNDKSHIPAASRPKLKRMLGRSLKIKWLNSLLFGLVGRSFGSGIIKKFYQVLVEV